MTTVEYELTADQLAAGELPVIWTFDVDNGDAATGQTIALYVDDELVGEASGDMDPDWTGSNGASFGASSTSFAAGGGNTALGNGVDFASGTINLDKGLQMFIDTLFTPGGPVDPPTPEGFEILDAVRTANGLEITWSSSAGTNYDVEFSTDLQSWTKINEAVIASAGASTAFEDTDAGRTGGDEGYYRVTTP